MSYIHQRVFVSYVEIYDNGALKCGGYYKECQLDIQALEKCGCEKTAVYELSRTGMVSGPAQDFRRYHEKDITRIRSHEGKLTKGVMGYGANSLYLYCSGDVMPCGKDALVVNKKPFDQKRIAKFSKDVLKDFLDLRKSTLKCLTDFMTSLARCHHCLLFKRFLIVIYLKK